MQVTAPKLAAGRVNARSQKLSRPARVPLRTVAAAAPSLSRSLSSHSRCEIVTPNGLAYYCNVVKASNREDGSVAYQFVVVVPQLDSNLETTDMTYFKSEYYNSVEECNAAIDVFDIKQQLPQLFVA